MLYAKYAAKWDVQIVEMIFQTRSGIMEMIFNNFPKFSLDVYKRQDQLHPHCPPFVSPSAPLCSADGCENTE